jgi:hypothetical protein
MSSTVTIHYHFHPHVGQTLPVVARPRHANGAYTVKDPAGSPLQVPVWMTESTATPIFAARNRLTFLMVSLNVFKEQGCFL